jgi:hypothetical protein
MKTMHAQTRNAAHATTAQLIVDQEKRAEVLSNRFARYMLMVEDSIYMSMRRIVPDFGVGYWHFFELSNGGFYMAPGICAFEGLRPVAHSSFERVRGKFTGRVDAREGAQALA